MEILLNEIYTNKEKMCKLSERPTNSTELVKWMKLELAYTSNAIEGNTLTRKETVRIINENITSSPKPFVYYQEAKNHAKAFDRILELVNNNEDMSESELLNIHKIILSGIDSENAGFYRNCRVSISGSRVVLPNPIKVPMLMGEFFDWLNKQDKTSPLTAIEAHFRFVKIHPFVDGNGRCARLLMNFLLLKAGFSPLIIRPIDRKRYIDNIEKYQLTEVSQSYTKFMLNALNRSIATCINLFDIEREDYEKSDLLTIAKFAKLVNLPVSTIRYWVKTNQIKPVQYTISGYMQFAKSQKAEVETIIKNKTK